jgi:[CysO sulfur-carrier protein]-S-L-cysteine hydrolase
MTELRLPASMQEAIIAHARAELPRESCGLIAGKNGEPTRLYRLTNVEAGNQLYRIDDDELYVVTREIDERDEEIFVIYHSHPVTEAYPSKTDVDLAFYPDAYYVICSLQDETHPSLRAFRIENEQIHEVPIQSAH